MRLRRLAASLLAVGVVALLLGAGIVRHQETASWQTMAAVASSYAAEREARDTTRPVLWGKARDGAAFPHYEQALDWAAELRKEDHERFVAALRRDDHDLATDEDVAAMRQRWRPVIDALRVGAHSLDARPCDDVIDSETYIVSLLAARAIVNAAVLEARLLRHGDRLVEAVERTLDAAAFGADLVHRGILIHQMTGCALVTIATAEAWSDQALRQLDAEALAVLATGLARLDERLPTQLYLADELAFLAAQLRHAEHGSWATVRLDSWRYGFSQRWMAADAFLQLAEATRELDAAELPWPARRAELDRLFASQAATANPIVAASAINYRAAEESLRECVARVRLLRLAVELHRGTPLPALADPLGVGPLEVDRGLQPIRLASVGQRADRLIERSVQVRGR